MVFGDGLARKCTKSDGVGVLEAGGCLDQKPLVNDLVS